MICQYGKVAMVTGGATGIGAAVTEKLVREGFRVACCYNSSREKALMLQEKLKEKNFSIKIFRVDVSNSESVKDCVRSISGHYGDDISILVNNAGDVISYSPVEEMSEELWDRVMSINLRGTFLCSKYCIPGMKTRRSGRIINMSSISARTGGGFGAAHYVASKGGIEALTRAMAVELAGYGICVNSISPGVIFTPFHERHSSAEKLEKSRERIPAGRIGQPEDVAGIVSFLCTEQASYITGQMIAVNGGMRMD